MTPAPILRASRTLTGTPAGRTFLSALAGTLLFLACADFDIWPLAWFGLVPLLAVLFDHEGVPRVRRPFFYGFVCGLLANGGGFYWIVGLLMRFGHMPFVAAAPIFLLLVAYQALTFAIFASLLCRLRAHIDVSITWLAPLCWVACELCVPYIFPWYLAITQAWVPPVIQIADITGPLGVSFLLVLSSGAIFDLCALAVRCRGSGKRFFSLSTLAIPASAALTVLFCLGYGLVRIEQIQSRRAQAPKIQIGVVQANIGIQEKFVPELRAQQLFVHQRLSQDLQRRGADLIVWPESSYPYALRRPVQRDFPESDPRMVRRGFDRPLLFGALTVDTSGRDVIPYNTALLMDATGQVTGSFDKNFLLVFGEYIPYAEHMGWLKQLVPEMSNFARGTTTTTFPLPHQGKDYVIGPMICYEDIIPAFGRRLFDTPSPPNLLINITNDAWFGATSEPYEHMALSVFRAVEHRVDLVRAVNTGVSAFIDATGKVYAKGPAVDPLITPGVPPTTLLREAALMQPGGLYQRLGETFGGVCLAIVLGLAILARRRARRPVHWLWLLPAVAALHALVLAVGLLGPDVGLVYRVLSHRAEHDLPQELAFQAAWLLALSLSLGCAVLGAALAVIGARSQREPVEGGVVPGRLEAIAAIVCVTVVPVLLFGRMEGNTGSVVLLSLLCSGAALFGGRLARRLAPR
jgi:apolipoprotein N-acyltransferase